MASLIARGGTILPKYNALILYLVIVLSDSHLVTGWIGREIVTCRTKDVLRSGDASDRGGEGGVRRPRPILRHRSSASRPETSVDTYAPLTRLMLPPFCRRRRIG